MTHGKIGLILLKKRSFFSIPNKTTYAILIAVIILAILIIALGVVLILEHFNLKGATTEELTTSLPPFNDD